MNPKYPVYIVSRKRSGSRYTVKALERLNVPYTVIIEPDDFDDYSNVIDKEKLLVVPEKYHLEYENCDDLGRTKSQGPGPARNFSWDDSISKGYDWHWVMDDNIEQFYRINYNQKTIVGDGTILRAMEDFCKRYSNVLMAGPNYDYFVPRKQKHQPIIFNTRIYSCNQ